MGHVPLFKQKKITKEMAHYFILVAHQSVRKFFKKCDKGGKVGASISYEHISSLKKDIGHNIIFLHFRTIFDGYPVEIRRNDAELTPCKPYVDRTYFSTCCL